MARTRAALPSLIATMILASGLAPATRADPIQVTYSTVGVVGDASLDGTSVQYWPSPGSTGSTGISGTPVVSFQGVTDGTLTTGQPFDLGQLVVGAMPAGTTTTYNNTPFQVAFTQEAVNGVAPSGGSTTVVLDGFLSGTITAGSSPQLTAWFDPVAFPGGPPFATTSDLFTTGGLTSGIYAPYASSVGQPMQAYLDTGHGPMPIEQAAPEPGTLAVFLAMAAFASRYAPGRLRRATAARAPHRGGSADGPAPTRSRPGFEAEA